MRKWFKYSSRYSDVSDPKIITCSQDSSYAEHAEGMGGYEPDAAYENKNSFFQKYYFNYHQGRLEGYDTFLRKHIKKTDRVLSVASGRSSNELRLLDEGYDITCSDLGIPPCLDATKKLFHNFKFFTLDIIESPAAHQYDGLISLGLIYLFDDRQLDNFFRNISKTLNNNGYLILDSSGSPDNLISFFIHDVLLKIEVHLLRFLVFLKSVGQKKYGFTIKHHGYRRNDGEIIQIAEKNGFKLIDQDNYAFLIEFQRSAILRRLIKIPYCKQIFKMIGRHVPYTRMFLFRKRES